MTDSGSARRQRSVPIWARLATGAVVAVGAFCLAYHLVFWFLWRFLFGEEVWPWPAWSLWVLVILPSVIAVAAALFVVIARITQRNMWIAFGIVALALFGLLGYGGEVWKVMFQLGFRP